MPVIHDARQIRRHAVRAIDPRDPRAQRLDEP